MSHPNVSPECVERVHAWVVDNCPGGVLVHSDFLTGLLAVVEAEVERAVREQCWKWVRKAGTPCHN